MNRIAGVMLAVSLCCALGCKPSHPSKVEIDPDFDPTGVNTVLVAPFISSVIEGQDPERDSERIMNQTLQDLLAERRDYVFLTPTQFKGAVYAAQAGAEYERFVQSWIRSHEADVEFLGKIKRNLDVDLVMIPQVYLWFKDEADYREAGTASSTQVGATLSLVDPSTGAIVWEAMDENYKEAVRTEGNREQVIAGGVTRRVAGVTETGRDMYAAPPYEDVALLVLESLVGAIPERGAAGR
jgi:hypothetical protein